MAAAADQFDRFGFNGTSISSICEKAGCTSGALYFHFKQGKSALAKAVVEEHFAHWPAIVEQHVARDAPALDRLIVLSYEVARAFREDVIVRGGARLWAERSSIPVTMPRPFIQWLHVVAELLAAARDNGEVAWHVDPRSAARVLVAAFFGIHTVSDALDERRQIEDRLSELWRLLLPSLQPHVDPELVRIRAAPR